VSGCAGASDPASIMAAAATNASFNATFSGIGLHYEHNLQAPEVEAGGEWDRRPVWRST
jgi:hypothetical protein